MPQQYKLPEFYTLSSDPKLETSDLFLQRIKKEYFEGTIAARKTIDFFLDHIYSLVKYNKIRGQLSYVTIKNLLSEFPILRPTITSLGLIQFRSVFGIVNPAIHLTITLEELLQNKRTIPIYEYRQQPTDPILETTLPMYLRIGKTLVAVDQRHMELLYCFNTNGILDTQEHLVENYPHATQNDIGLWNDPNGIANVVSCLNRSFWEAKVGTRIESARRDYGNGTYQIITKH